MSLEPLEYLRHILAEAEYLQTACAGLTREQFQNDATLRRAAVRSLEIIGEAAKKVPGAMRAESPDVAWRAMAGMRDIGRLPPERRTRLVELRRRRSEYVVAD